MKTRAAGIILALCSILAISSQVPMVMGVPSSTMIEKVSCMGLPSGFAGQVVFNVTTRFSEGYPTYPCDDNGTLTVERTTYGYKDKLMVWSITVRIINASGVVVAENFDSGSKAKSSMTVTVTATFDTMSVAGSLEWSR